MKHGMRLSQPSIFCVRISKERPQCRPNPDQVRDSLPDISAPELLLPFKDGGDIIGVRGTEA